MRYEVRHRTTYDYEDAVSVSHHILHLVPHSTRSQTCRRSDISIVPRPPARQTHVDYFGNTVTLFTLLEPHERLTVEASADVEVRANPLPDFSSSPAWEKVRDLFAGLNNGAITDEALNACQFIFDSSRAPARAEFADYAAQSFPPGCPLLEGTLDLTRRIYHDFRFDSKATKVNTPVETFFEKRRGVCQDFAHLHIACMRSLGLAARYISGYLRTIPPPGRARLQGADASHAWVCVWSPGQGWIDFDPTNNCVPADGHITTAWGRDYGDVSPVRGVLLGGSRHTLEVAVDVMPMD